MQLTEDPTDPEVIAIMERARKYQHLLPRASEAFAARAQSSITEPAPPRNGRFYEGPKPLTSGPWRPVSAEEGRAKAIGAMVGMAVGDAVGTTLEFQLRDRATITDMVGGGPFSLQPGQWTDDTSMALCLAQALVEQGDFKPHAFADELVAWYREGRHSPTGTCFDIGNTTRRAIESYIATGTTSEAPAEFSSSGNGSLVRAAPAAIFTRGNFQRMWTIAGAQSAVTHRAVHAVSAAQFFSAKIWDALNGASKEEALSPRVLPVTSRVLLVNAGEYKTKARSEISSSGFAIDTLEAALWSVWTTGNFEDAVLTAANLADDADSVAAAAGQLAGALYGVDAIPQHWRQRLAWYDRIEALAVRLFDMAPAYS